MLWGEGFWFLIFDFNSKFDFGCLSHIASSLVFSIWKPWRYKQQRPMQGQYRISHSRNCCNSMYCAICDILILFLACPRNNKPSVLSTFTLSKPSFYTSRVSMFYNADRSAVIILTRLQSKSQYKCSNISVNSPWKIFLLRNLSQKLDHFGCITLHNLRKTSWSLSLLKEQSWLAKSQCNSP